ncbi:hypothetical protein FKM82_007374 [Ascaphus truei]
MKTFVSTSLRGPRNLQLTGGENKTVVKDILLLGFQRLHNFKIPLFVLFLMLYGVTLTGNVMIVALVSASPSLHHPMFFFLSHLSLSDIILTTDIVPKMLRVIWRGGDTISVTGCITQFQFFGVALASECLLLTVMSYDRYLAICHPLRYVSIMGTNLRLHLVFWCWLLSFLISLVTVVLVSKLQFCGPNVIDHFFCDFVPLLQLSCSDTSVVEMENVLLATPITLFPVIFISVTYAIIFVTIFRIPSTTGRRKAFSTCSSHLAVVCTFFGTLVTLYVVPPNGDSLAANKVLSLLYTMATPLFNPIIYSLRNKEIRAALMNYRCTRKDGRKDEL